MALRIRAQEDGYRRAGVAHSADWVEHPDDAFDAAELAALHADPRITIEHQVGGQEKDGTPPPIPPGAWAEIAAAIKGLDAEGYGANGKPTVPAINAALPKDSMAIDASARDLVWGDLLRSGFAAPTKTGG